MVEFFVAASMFQVKNSRPQSVVTQPNDPRKAARQQTVQEQPAAANGKNAEAEGSSDRRPKTRDERSSAADDAGAGSARGDAKGRKEILERFVSYSSTFPTHIYIHHSLFSYRRESDDSGSGDGRKGSKRARNDDRSARKHRSRSPPADSASSKKRQKSPLPSEVERTRSSRDSSPSTARRDSTDNHDSG